MSSNRREFLKGSAAAAAIGGLGSIADQGRAADSPEGEVLFHRHITVRHDVDVFVAGGGPAGVAAAVAAARQGARVFLAERNTCLGGMGSYGIPYRCLVPRKLTNVLVAGRCVSTDRYMQSSIRVMPGCFITGQAIGVAAAICAKQGCDTRSVPMPELHRRLKNLGAYLPNC
jgi:hypothetical protein